MGSFIFGLLWFLITIAFLTMFIITIVRIAKKGKIIIPLISSIILFIAGLICFIGIFVAIPENDDYSVKENKASEQPGKSSSNDNEKDNDTSDKKSLKIGDQLTVGKVDVTVEKAEFVEPEDEYSTPDNGKILKVYYKFKNNAEEQILVSDTDFLLSINGETQQEFYLMDDMQAGFVDQLNKGNTVSGYVYYDVPDSDEYKVEMDFTPFYNTYKAEWVINKSDIQ